MKLKSLALAFGATLVAMTGAVSCGNSQVTKLTGVLDEDGFDEVNIIVDKYDVDTLVPIQGGKFYIDLPVDPTEVAFVAAGYYRAYFILDGTKLTLKIGEESTVVSSSKNSIQNAYNEFEDHVDQMNKDFLMQVSALTEGEDDAPDQTLFEELYNGAVDGIVDYIEQVIFDNRDNAISGIALNKLTGIVPDDQLGYLISLLSEEMQQSTFVAPLTEELEVKAQTAEGKPFVDFTIEDSDGKTVSLSDYVGKGRYVLVDFWASWCEPCKEEIPNVKAVYNKYRRKGLDVLSVAIADEPQASKDTARAYGIVWNQIINAGQIPAQIYGISSIPHIILFGPDGTILKRDLRGEEIEAEVAKYIK